MAGIGFRLRRLAGEETYVHAAAAYLSSAVISAGPWLSAVVSLGLLAGATAAFLGSEERDLLFATITYAFGLSMVLAGAPQLIVTRYLADRFYSDDLPAIAPACTGVLAQGGLFLLVASPFVVLAPFELPYRLLAASLFVTFSLIWLVVVFLSAARDYWRLVATYCGGYALSLGAAVWLGQAHGLLGALGGFTLGQVVCLGLLASHVYLEFPSPRGASLAFLGYARRYWDLALIGLLYAGGIWIDNVVYWHTPEAVLIGGYYRLLPAYDSAKAWAYLTTIPASAVFLVNLETSFCQHYRAFYDRIIGKGTLTQIAQAKRGMCEAARTAVVTLIKIQGLVAVAALLLAPDLARWFGLQPEQVAYFRVLVLGASGQLLVLVALLFLLYLDQRRAALLVIGAFVAVNAGCTLLTVRLGPATFGMGYVAAGFVGAVLGLGCLRDRLRRLEYLTFMLQPMARS
jgi:uncharacterized membrane protein